MLLLAAILSAITSTLSAQRILSLGSQDPQYFEQLKNSTAPVMAMTEQQLRELVPTSAGLRWLTCPSCKIRTRTANWEWSIEDPHHITCTDCQARFPDHPDFPYDGKDVVDDREYPYYTSPEGVRYHFGLVADWHLKEYLARAARDLAELYHHTGNEQYAQTSLHILDEFARKFPQYPVIFNGMWINQPTKIAAFSENEEVDLKDIPHIRRTRWSFWRYMDLSREAMTAMDALSSWPGLQTEEGKVMRERIFRDMLIPQGEWVRPILGKHYGNMNASHVYPDQLYLARLTNDPKRMHETLEDLYKFFGNRFLYDGHWFETSPSYGRQVRGGLLRIAAIAKGYSDPEGYQHPDTGKRIDNLDLESTSLYRALEESLFSPRLPNGRLIPLNDTWASSTPYPERDSMEPVFLPGLGVGVLGNGESTNQIHAFLSFTSGVAHKQSDTLSIGLFAHNHELLPTIGYTHTRYRRWASSLMSHNTVVVNGIESARDPKHTGNIPELFYTDTEQGLQIVVARSDNAYPKQTELHRRALLLIGTPEESPYLLDLFHVIGGKQHDYLLHGSRDVDASVSLPGVDMNPFEGTLMNPGAKFVEPRSERDNAGGNASGYGFVRNLSIGIPHHQQTEILIQLEDGSGTLLRTLLSTEMQDRIYTGESPSIRRAGGRHFKENEALLDVHLSPFFCLRRQGNHLESFFAATHEPLSGSPARVQSIRTAKQQNLNLIEVTLEEGKIDYILFAPDGGTITADLPMGKLEFSGHYAVIRTQNNKLARSWLIGGEHLLLNGKALTSQAGHYNGAITAYSREETANSRGYFDLDAALPEGNYSALRIQFPDQTERSFNVVKTIPYGKGSRLYVKEDPGFDVEQDKIQITSFPQRTIRGTKLVYRIFKVDTYSTDPN